MSLLNRGDLQLISLGELAYFVLVVCVEVFSMIMSSVRLLHSAGEMVRWRSVTDESFTLCNPDVTGR